MSLSAAEKVRVVHPLDDLGVHMIEAGFPASNPKELEPFALLEREVLRGPRWRPSGRRAGATLAAEEDPALRALAELLRAVCTLVGKTWGLHLEKVVRVDRDENLKHDR